MTYLGLATSARRWRCWSGCSPTPSYHRTAPRGWASTLVIVLFMGSIQLISLGIIGEYIRLIFLETKRRPTYIVRDHRRAAGRRPDRARSPGRARAVRGSRRAMIGRWSEGVADDNMAEEILVELAGPDPAPSLVAGPRRA